MPSNLSTLPVASPGLIRLHYHKMGYEAHISREGRVTFRPKYEKRARYREGGYVSDYRACEGEAVKVT
jgi:hypothetical protein